MCYTDIRNIRNTDIIDFDAIQDLGLGSFNISCNKLASFFLLLQYYYWWYKSLRFFSFKPFARSNGKNSPSTNSSSFCASTVCRYFNHFSESLGSFYEQFKPLSVVVYATFYRYYVRRCSYKWFTSAKLCTVYMHNAVISQSHLFAHNITSEPHRNNLLKF